MLMTLLRKLNLSYRLFVLIGIFATGFLVYGAWSFKTLDELKVNGPLYAGIVASKDVVADALPPPLFIIESQLVSLQMTAPGIDAQRLAGLEARLHRLRSAHAERSRHWAASNGDPRTGVLLDEAAAPARAFYDAAFGGLLPALRSEDRPAAARALESMTASYEQHRLAVERLVAHAAASARSAESLAAAHIDEDSNLLRLILAAALCLAVFAAMQIERSITRPLREAVDVARRVAAGDMRPPQHTRAPDEAGILLDALDSMSRSLSATMDERSASELSLRRAKELTERLIDSASVMIVGLDHEGKVVIFNEAACAATGYSRSQVLGQVWRALPLVGPANALHWPGAGAWPQTSEHSIVTPAGEQRCIAWQNTALGEEGGAIALMAFGIDVTAQRAAHAETLAAREQAEAATRSKSEFLANMSHEIRTPMNAVIGMTRLALKTELDARQRNYLEKVDHAAQGLLGIINDILDFSKIEAGKLRFEQRALHLRQTLDQLAGLTVYRAQEKGLELLFDVAPEVPLELVGDPLRLGQVLLNLVNNAIKFTEHGEIVVAIRLVSVDDGEAVLRFEVRDSGIGVSPEQAARLFQAFMQGDASTTRTHGGTGLGLSICRRLVEMMDGTLSLDSTPGQGSTFSFTARLGVVHAPRPLSAEPSVRAMRVLVVDDNAAAREIMQGILESLRMRVTIFAEAAPAIGELEQAERQGDPYQLVMMDWIMPNMDGLAAIRAIRANPAISNLLDIIMVTAYSRDDLLEQAAGLDRLGVLDKPVTPSSVLDAIVDGYSAAGARAPLPVAPQRRMTAARLRLRGARVLLVEDNEVNQELAVEILEGLGMIVQVAVNGAVALDMLGSARFDAVLMDCQMPVMDGFEATRQIRRQPRLARLPVLAMTANAMSGDRERCIEAGMNEHISKPIDPDVLALLLAQWIEAAPAPALAAAPAGSAALERLRSAGIDAGGALERLQGNDIAWNKQARLIAETQADLPAQLRQACARGELERARRMAHNLHGLAGKVGAMELAAYAEAVETAVHDGSGMDASLAALEPVLAQVVAALAEYQRG